MLFTTGIMFLDTIIKKITSMDKITVNMFQDTVYVFPMTRQRVPTLRAV